MLSVVICTHDPNEAYLRRALAALQAQTLPGAAWELVVVDNGSARRVAEWCDLAWHPRARHVREPELGLTPARLRGIRESGGELIVFVDDDNVLDPDYLAVAARIARDKPFLGAFSGSLRAEFEIDPPAWITPYLAGLAVAEIDRDSWTNMKSWSEATPAGAGMCVRREVAEEYLRLARQDHRRVYLDRRGQSLGAGGDNDLAWCSMDLGLGTGRFSALKLAHLIPTQRMTKDHIVRLNAGFAGARVILGAIHRPQQKPPRPAWRQALRAASYLIRGKIIPARIAWASMKTLGEAQRLIEQMNSLPDAAEQLAAATNSRAA